MGMISVLGKNFPVTAKFDAEVLMPHPDLATASYDALVKMRDKILETSTLRNSYRSPMPKGQKMAANGTLTFDEQTRLDNIVHVINVHHAVNFLQERAIDDFGFDGIDQVHGNSQRHACGCNLTVVFDHHLRSKNEKVLHPHYPRYSCETHEHLMGDFKAHHAAVVEHNKTKEPA